MTTQSPVTAENYKVTPVPGPFFHKLLTLGLDPGRKEKCRILPESTPALRFRYHLWYNPGVSEISDLRNFWLHTMYACT